MESLLTAATTAMPRDPYRVGAGSGSSDFTNAPNTIPGSTAWIRETIERPRGNLKEVQGPGKELPGQPRAGWLSCTHVPSGRQWISMLPNNSLCVLHFMFGAGFEKVSRVGVDFLG